MKQEYVIDKIPKEEAELCIRCGIYKSRQDILLCQACFDIERDKLYELLKARYGVK